MIFLAIALLGLAAIVLGLGGIVANRADAAKIEANVLAIARAAYLGPAVVDRNYR